MSEKNDREKLRAAFAEFRELGYWSRMAQDNGWRAVPEDVLRRSGSVVFWHANETSKALSLGGDLIGPLHLHHLVKDVPQVTEVLRKHGLHSVVEHGSHFDGVVVLPGEAPSQPVEAHEYIGQRYQLELTTNEETVVLSALVTDVDAAAGTLRFVIEEFSGTWVTMPVRVFADSIVCGMIAPEVL